jgi:hypothetical protein
MAGNQRQGLTLLLVLLALLLWEHPVVSAPTGTADLCTQS